MPVNDFFNSCEATKQSNAVPLSVLRNVEMIVDDPDGRPFAHRTQFWSCSVPDGATMEERRSAQSWARSHFFDTSSWRGILRRHPDFEARPPAQQRRLGKDI